MRHPRVTAAAAALLLGLTLSSCAEDEAEPTATDADVDETPSSAPVSVATSEPAATLSASPGESEPTATLSVTEEPSATMSSPTAPADLDLAAMLLPAQRMGKLNAEWRWAGTNDFDREPDGISVCHRAKLLDVGADEVAVREYTSDLDAGVRAYHLVAGFADDVTARRAYSVVQSWRGDCARRLEQRSPGNDRVHVSPAEGISSSAEAAGSYVVIRPTATGITRIDNVAVAHDDRVLDLVVVKLEGDDFNYPRGRTPAAIGVRNATERSG